MDDPAEPREAVPTVLDARRLEQLSAVPDLISIIALDGTIRWVDDRGAQTLGYTPAEMIGTSAYQYLHPDDVEPSQLAMMLGAVRPDGLIPVPLRYQHRDGTVHVFETWPRVVSLRQPDGSSELVVVASSRDTRIRLDFEEVLRSIAAGEPAAQTLDRVVQLASQVTVGWSAGLVVAGHTHPGIPPTSEAPVAMMQVFCGVLPPMLMDASAYAPGQVPWEQAAASGELVSIPSLDDFPAPVRAVAAETGLVAVVACPVPDPGSPHPAVLVVWCDLTLSASVVPAWLETQVVPLLEVALEQRRARAELEWAARYDSLTGLANRARLFELLGRTLARCGPDDQVGILYVDLDGFKEVNDTHGHATGDQVLAATASRFTDAVRPVDIVGRIGGDEFVVVCPECRGADEAAAVAKRLVAVLAAPIPLAEGGEVRVGASVGAVLAGAEASPDAALRGADLALYRAKNQGRGSVVVVTGG